MDSCGYGGAWYPGQFEEYDKEEKTLKVNFMHPSDSSSTKFVWPEFGLLGLPDVGWVKESKTLFIIFSI